MILWRKVADALDDEVRKLLNVDSDSDFKCGCFKCGVTRFANCDVCIKYFRNKDDHVEHMRTVHEVRFAHCDVWQDDF